MHLSTLYSRDDLFVIVPDGIWSSEGYPHGVQTTQLGARETAGKVEGWLPKRASDLSRNIMYP